MWGGVLATFICGFPKSNGSLTDSFFSLRMMYLVLRGFTSLPIMLGNSWAVNIIWSICDFVAAAHHVIYEGEAELSNDFVFCPLLKCK